MRKLLIATFLILTTNSISAMDKQIENLNQSLEKYFEPIPLKKQISYMGKKVIADVKTTREKKAADSIQTHYKITYNFSYYDIDSDCGCYTTKTDKTKKINSHELETTLKEIISSADQTKMTVSDKQNNIKTLQNYLKKLLTVEGTSTKSHKKLITDVINIKACYSAFLNKSEPIV